MTRKPKVYVVNSDIIDRFSKGQNCNQIAAVYGVGHQTIVRALRSAGIRAPGSGRPWSRDEERLLMRLKGEGRERHEIADLMSRSWSSVDSKLKRISEVNDPELYMRQRGVWYGEAA